MCKNLISTYGKKLIKREIILDFNHKTVLLRETLEFLKVNPAGVYVDGTAGGAGLSLEIAKKLSEDGKLISIDRDPDAILTCKQRLKDYKNAFVVHDNFSNVLDIVHNLGLDFVNGVVLDLGVSSYQLDEAERGFSYKNDAPLDMRMSKSGESAYDVVNNLEYDDLKSIISRYGEEKFSARIASNIIRYRTQKKIETTTELTEIVKNSIPSAARREGGHPAKRTFQAIRIHVNRELESLKKGLDESFKVLKKGGRILVITFHSLEDRIVKEKMKEWSQGCVCPPSFPICVCGQAPKAQFIHKKAIKPTEEEVAINFRSRSAKLRVCEKLI